MTPEIQAWLDEYGELESEKLDAIAMFIRSKEHQADGFKKVAEEFTAKRRTAENAVARLKDYLKFYLQAQGITSIKGKLYTAALTKNGGLPPLILTTENPDAFPEECRRVSVMIDGAAVRELIAAGDPKIAEVAHLGEVGSHVRLR